MSERIRGSYDDVLYKSTSLDVNNVRQFKPHIASTKIFLNLLIQFHLNNVTNLHQLTSYSTTSCPTKCISDRDHRLL